MRVLEATVDSARGLLVSEPDEPIGLVRVILSYRPKPLHEQVYERWRRRKAKNPKITLRQVCEELGVSYAAISSAKYRAEKRRQRE